MYGKVYFDKIVLKVPGLKGNDSYDYTGKKEDEGTGLKYFGARFYDPEVGRFLTLDPKKDGANWYVYCRDNPINKIDPDGFKPRDCSSVLSKSKYHTIEDKYRGSSYGGCGMDSWYYSVYSRIICNFPSD